MTLGSLGPLEKRAFGSGGEGAGWDLKSILWKMKKGKGFWRGGENVNETTSKYIRV